MKKILTFIFTLFMISFFSLFCCCYAFGPSEERLYNGIDISKWQGTIDFKRVKEDGIDVVYIKATQGSDYIDSYFERNYKGAKENNLKIGLYHFLTARDTEEARDEADFFSSVISKKQVDCRLAMDFEAFGRLNRAEINEISKAFLERVKEKTGKEMVIYSDSSNARDIFDEELAKKYPIWVAEYGVREPFSNGKWQSWVGFQYADNGRIRGIRGLVDKDYYTSGIFLSDTSKVPETEHRNNKDKTKEIRVRRGETLSKIAIEYNTSVGELVDLNRIRNRNLIYVGQILRIPYSIEEAKGETNHFIYTVKNGNTLSEIAKKFNISVKEIVRLNNIRNPNLIYVGEAIRIEIK